MQPSSSSERTTIHISPFASFQRRHSDFKQQLAGIYSQGVETISPRGTSPAMTLPLRNNNAPFLSKKARSDAYAGLCIFGASALILAVYRGCGHCEIQPILHRRLDEPLQVSGGARIPSGISYGNGLLDGSNHAGWFIGHFIDEGKPQHTEDIEVKFTFNPTGKKNDGFVSNRMSRSMAVLISGKHRVDFSNYSVLLEKPGDYAIWGAGVGHSWTSLMDSTILTLRWPSIPRDQTTVDTISLPLQDKQNSDLQTQQRNDNANTADPAGPSMQSSIQDGNNPPSQAAQPLNPAHQALLEARAQSEEQTDARGAKANVQPAGANMLANMVQGVRS